MPCFAATLQAGQHATLALKPCIQVMHAADIQQQENNPHRTASTLQPVLGILELISQVK